MSENRRISKNRQRILEICLIPLIATIIFAFKWAMASLPNIEPVTFLIIVFSLSFRMRVVLPAVYIYVFLEFATQPTGFWIYGYLYIWGLICLFTYLCKRIKSVHFWTVISAVFGLMFGFLYTFPTFFTKGWSVGVSWFISGLPFDILHFFGNFAIMRWLYSPVMKVLNSVNRFLK